MSYDDLKKDPLLYNSRIFNVWINYLKDKYPNININNILSYAQISINEVKDQGCFFSQQQSDRFYEKILELTKNNNIAREAGRYVAHPNLLGAMEYFTFGQFSVYNIYKIIGKLSEYYAPSSVYKTKKIRSNKVEITVTPKDGVQEKKYQCENRIGIFEAIVLRFTKKLPKIEHPECIFNGDSCCRYIIEWKTLDSNILNSIKKYIIIILLLLDLGLIFIVPKLFLTTILPYSIIVALSLSFITNYFEKKELTTSIFNLQNSSEKLVEQININHNNIRLNKELGEALSKQLTCEDILFKISNIMQKRLDYDRGLILLSDQNNNKLEFKAGYGFNDKQTKILKKTTFNLLNRNSKGIFNVVFREQKPLLINGISEIENTLSRKSLNFAKELETGSFICCPITFENQSLGIIAADNIKSRKELVQSDLNLLNSIAQVLGMSLKNAELIQSKLNQFKCILKVLAATIDARDPLTAGHSEKVSEYALGICDEMNYSKKFKEVIQIAALLHDYGKVAIPDSILKKEGKLSSKEYELIKIHAQKSKEILQQIHFEGHFKEIPEIAGSHHEKIDGSGYPQGLKGDEIHIGARIIAVADVFEAITSRRHYRDPLPTKEAFSILIQEAGIKYEKKFVQALIRYHQKNYDKIYLPIKKDKTVLHEWFVT